VQKYLLSWKSSFPYVNIILNENAFLFAFNG
jgi:hypothetical protein